MSRASNRQPVSIEDYLASEMVSSVKHEYVGGAVYAMAGARNADNLIASNTLVAIGSRLGGTGCRAYNSDTKIRLRLPSQTRFYYPDVSVICRPNPQTDSFQDEPAAVVEVISDNTRRIDEGEKREGYCTIPSLIAYILVEQETASATLFRRTDSGFVREVYAGGDAVIPLREIALELPLSAMYEGVRFNPEVEDVEPR
jgi:Uma2 family endonuclease